MPTLWQGHFQLLVDFEPGSSPGSHGRLQPPGMAARSGSNALRYAGASAGVVTWQLASRPVLVKMYILYACYYGFVFSVM